MPARVASLYRFFRVFDLPLLAVSLLVILLWAPSALTLALALAIWSFATLEYLNYFLIRLAYSPSHWLRDVSRNQTPRLLRDLKRES